MKTLIKSVAAISLAAAAVAASPASSQVTGKIAVLSPTEVVLKASAFQTAYSQIATTYSVQRNTMQQRNQQIEQLLVQLDTNADKQLDEAEQTAAKNTPQWAQIEQLENEVAVLQNQINRARIYAIEQILRVYPTAAQKVVDDQKIQIVFAPEAVQIALPQANIGDQVVAALNTLAPTVGITPPENWQPSQLAVTQFQEIQQILVASTQMQMQAEAQAAAAAGTAPAQAAPVGR